MVSKARLRRAAPIRRLRVMTMYVGRIVAAGDDGPVIRRCKHCHAFWTVLAWPSTRYSLEICEGCCAVSEQQLGSLFDAAASTP